MSSLFRRGSNPKTEARLGLLGYDDRLISDGFLSAAAILVRSLKETDTHPHLLVYPLVFNVRHYVELKLKHIVRLMKSFYSFPDENTVDSALLSHRLDILLELVLQGILAKEPALSESEEIEILKRGVTELHEHDPESYAFRYTFDRRGRRNVVPNTAFDLEGFWEEIERLAVLLDDVESWCVDEKVARLNAWAAAINDALAKLERPAVPGERGERIRSMTGNALQLQWTRSGTGRWVTCQLFPDKLVHMWCWNESDPGKILEEVRVPPEPGDTLAVEQAAKAILEFLYQ